MFKNNIRTLLVLFLFIWSNNIFGQNNGEIVDESSEVIDNLNSDSDSLHNDNINEPIDSNSFQPQIYNKKMVAGTTMDEMKTTYVGSKPQTSGGTIWKRYSICPVEDTCRPKKWVGFMGMDLLKDVKGNNAATKEARKFVAIASVKTTIGMSIPIFVILGLKSLIDYSEKSVEAEDAGLPPSDIESNHMTYFGLAIGGVALGWIGSFMESAQVKKVAAAFNKQNEISIQFKNGKKETKLSFKGDF